MTIIGLLAKASLMLFIEGLRLQVKRKNGNTKPHFSANFVGIVVGFLNVLVIRLVVSSLPSRYPLNAAWYKTLYKNII
jgi:hypothetical protein